MPMWKTLFNHVFVLIKCYKIKSRTKHYWLNWKGTSQGISTIPELRQELVTDLLCVFSKTPHLDLQTPIYLLWAPIICFELKTPKNGNLLHRYNHTTTLPNKCPNIFHSYACPGQDITIKYGWPYTFCATRLGTELMTQLESHEMYQ